MRPRRVTTLLAMAVALMAGAHPAAASSVGPYGVNRVTMLATDIDGRPLTFSESDIFACVALRGEARARVYRVPYGYVTDQTSIPRRAIAFLLGDKGRLAMYANAAIVHDYLYASGDAADKAGRATADRIMAELLEAEGVNTRVIRMIDLAFSAARGVGGWAERAAEFFARQELPALKQWIDALKGAFGADREWKRWADPYTLDLLKGSHLPRSPAEAKPVTMLADCNVFDGRDVDESARRALHACLHLRFRSPANRPPLPADAAGLQRSWPAPRMPTALLDALSTVEARDPGGLTCDVFTRP